MRVGRPDDLASSAPNVTAKLDGPLRPPTRLEDGYGTRPDEMRTPTPCDRGDLAKAIGE